MMTSTNKISMSIRLSFRNFLDADRLYRASATKERNSHVIIGFMLLLLGGSYFVFRFVQPSAYPQKPGDLTPAISTGALAFGVIFIFDLLPIAVLWLLSRQHLQQYPEPYDLLFDDNGIRFIYKTANATYEWNFYHEAFEGKTVFILTYGKGLYSTIPKSVFHTEQEIDGFRQMLKNHLTNFRQTPRI